MSGFLIARPSRRTFSNQINRYVIGCRKLNLDMMQPRVTRGSMPFRQLVIVAAFAAALTAGACSKDRTPATPTPAAHASVAVTSVNVAGERAATGYVYRVVVRVKESGGVTATI